MLALAKPKLGLARTASLILDRLALVLFGRIADSFNKIFEMDQQLRRAGIETYPQLYTSRAFLHSVLVLIISSVFTVTFLGYAENLLLKAMLIIMPLITFSIVLLSYMIYPMAKASSRLIGVESELPFFAAYLSTMARGGVAPENVIERIANLKIFKYIRVEARKILRDVRMFGKDILTAIEDNAYHHPSRRYRNFLLGYVTTVRTGGDVLHYLELRTQDLFREEAENLKLIAEKVGLFIEAYIALAVIASISLYVFFVVSGILPFGGLLTGLGGMIIYSLVGLPLVTIMILFFIDTSQPKTPISNREPYAWFVVTAPIGALAGLTFFTFAGGTPLLLGNSEIRFYHIVVVMVSLIITLAIASAGPVNSYLNYKRLEARLHHYVANFLRDLAEVRKTGLSPEKSIITISERDYGTFTPIIKRVAAALSLGVDIERAVRTAIRGYKDWLSIATMRLLVDAIEFGGGAPDVLDSIARYFRALAEFRDELRRRLRPYSVMLYFGALLLAVASLLTIIILGGSLVQSGIAGTGIGALRIKITPQDMAALTLITTIGVMLSSWLMGLVIGKVQDLSAASGFIHSVILLVITAVASFVILLMGLGKVIPP